MTSKNFIHRTLVRASVSLIWDMYQATHNLLYVTSLPLIGITSISWIYSVFSYNELYKIKYMKESPS
jgi:hypothetical protein